MVTYKPSEFAKMIGVSTRTLQRWDTEGKLIAKRSPSNRRYYTQTQYDEYIHQNTYINSLDTFKRHVKDILSSNMHPFAMIQLDIDGLKTLNATYGEDVCDNILQQIQMVLTSFVKNKYDVINPSADIFMFIYEYSSKNILLNNIHELNKKLTDINKNIHYRISWGMYYIDNRNESVLSIIDKTTIARLSIKHHALTNIGLYTPEMQSNINHIQLIENKMVTALENNEFVLYLQPKYDLTTNRINGAEALIRWIESDGSMMEPSDFLPVFERNGFIVKTDRFIWEEACKLIKKWKLHNQPIVPISINVSRYNLENHDFIYYLNDLSEKYDIEKQYIEIEITESLDMPVDDTLIQKLKKNGFLLLMDDFGSGYSSLNTLHQTSFNIIKLDREFLSHFMESHYGEQIIQHTISMIKDINLDIIAEGVETKEQAKFLKDNGCNTVQGFLYSKPIPVDEFEKLLLENKE